MKPLLPVAHLTVRHNYTGSSWQEFTGSLSSAQITLREFIGRHTASLSFYNVAMDPSQSSGTRVIKKGDKVRIYAENNSGIRRKMATFKVKKVSVAIDLTARVGRQNKVTVHLHGTGVAGVSGTGGSAGVGSIEELSNTVTGAPYEINGEGPDLTYAWTGTANASTSTETDAAGNVRTNLVQDPAFQTGSGASGWIDNTGTAMSVNTTTPIAGGQSYDVAPTSENWGYFPMDGGSGGGVTRPAHTSGHTYTAQIRVRSTKTQDLMLTDYGDSATAGDTVRCSAGEPTWLTVTFTAGANVYLSVRDPARTRTIDKITIDQFFIEEAADLGSYFDGSSSNISGGLGIVAPTLGVVQRTNLCTNPSFETNTTGYSTTGTGLTISRVTSDHFSGAACLQAVSTGTVSDLRITVAGLTIGQVYTASAYCKATVGASTGFTVGVSGISTGASVVPDSPWQRAAYTFTATATSHIIIIKPTYPGPGSYTNLVDAVQIEKASAATAYFDGATTATDTRTYAWTGTANASTSTETATFTEVDTIDTASQHDQIILTRDSNPGVVAFEDPNGTIQIYDSAAHQTGSASHTITAHDYASIDIAFDMSHITNVLTIKYFERIPKVGNKKSRVVESSTVYENAPSIAKYGRFKKTHKVHKKSDFSAYATSVFARNADPTEVPTSVTIPMITASNLLPGYEDGHFVGQKVQVTLPDGVTTYNCRVAKIQHNISPTQWTVQVFLRAQDVMQKVRHHTALTSEVANNPSGTVLNDHLDANAIDNMTITPATSQTKTTGNRIVMRDDGSEGIIEFFSGTSGETAGHINPGVSSSIHYLDIQTSKAAAPYNTAGRIHMLGSSGIANPLMQLLGTDLSVGGSATVNNGLTSSGGYALSGGGSINGAVTNNGGITISGASNSLTISSPPTSASAANVFMGAGGVLNKVTSLRKAKVEIEPLSGAAVRGLLSVEAVSFYDRAEYEANGGPEGLHRIPGVIAEDVETHAPELAIYDGDELQGVAYDRIAVALIPIIREQQQQIADLTARLTALESRERQ